MTQSKASREAFEKWLKSVRTRPCLERTSTEYFSDDTERAWEGYKASEQRLLDMLGSEEGVTAVADAIKVAEIRARKLHTPFTSRHKARAALNAIIEKVKSV